MSYKELALISKDDLDVFLQFLADYYENLNVDPYSQVRKSIEKLFPLSRYPDPQDLTDATLTRLVRKVCEYKQKGIPIDNFEGFVVKISRFVAQEDARKRMRFVNLSLVHPDSGDVEQFDLEQPELDEGNEVEMQIRFSCLAHCIDQLPLRMKEIFKIYYPTYYIPPQHLAEIRRRLAMRCGRVRTDDSDIHLRNLQTRISKWREKKLDDCVRNCVTRERCVLRLKNVRI